MNQMLAARLALLWLLSSLPILAQPFHFPTANHALLEKGGEEKFFVGTIGKPWTSGTFGCVRSDGHQMHEGLDIRCQHRDKKGEPTDSVLATADGTVAYFNSKPSLSNYGKYIVLRHQVEGLEIYSLYAHLSAINARLKTGQMVKAGEPIAVMGRTSNTKERISPERAHVHFELNLFINERFPDWFKKTRPGERNDHGAWNGQNLVGLDPRLILLAQQAQGATFSLVEFIRSQTELSRVIVRDKNLSWAKRFPALLRPNPVAEKEGVAGYEIALNFNAVAFQLTPRAASEIKGTTKFQLLSVNAAEQEKNPARHLVARAGKGWELTSHGRDALELLAY